MRRPDAIGATPWRQVSPMEGESARWQCVDGRWIAIARGHGASAGKLLVLDWRGRCESARTLDEALALSSRWRKAE